MSLRDIEPNVTYELRSADRGRLGFLRGADLIAGGLEIEEAPESAAQVLVLEPATDPRAGSPSSPEKVMRHIIRGRGIPAGCVTPPSHTPGMLGRRALPSGRRAPRLMQLITFPGD